MIRFVPLSARQTLQIDRHTSGPLPVVISGRGSGAGVVAFGAPASLWIALDGGLRIARADAVVEIDAGSTRTLEAGATFTVESSAGHAGRWLGVLLPPAAAAVAWAGVAGFDAHEPVVLPATHAGDAALAAAAACLASAVAIDDSPGARTALRELVDAAMRRQLALESLVIRPGGTAVGPRRRLVLRLLRAREVLDAGEGPASVAAAARAASVSTSHLARLFRRVFGVTPARMLRRRRLAAARELLAGGGIGVAEVVRRLGFRNRTAFARAFRAAFGHPPSRTARNARARPAFEAARDGQEFPCAAG